MAVPSTIDDLSTTPASNSPAGSEAIGTSLDDYLRAHAAFIAQLHDGSLTLTNKTINLTNNTLTGTKAQFNTACSDDDFVFPSSTQTLTNKTIGDELLNTATSALQVAAGTTAQRPTGAVGKIRWNSDLSQYEGYNGASWVQLNAPGTATESTEGVVELASRLEVNGTHTTGSITTGTAALTVASGTGINNGDYVVGEGITVGTTVSSGGGTTSITLSANANATLSSKPVSFYRADRACSPGVIAGQLCRAWVNFNGTGTVAIRASYNVTSITDNGTGNYTVNFTTALSDANYAAVISNGRASVNTTDNPRPLSLVGSGYSTTLVQVINTVGTAGSVDYDIVTVAIFR